MIFMVLEANILNQKEKTKMRGL